MYPSSLNHHHRHHHHHHQAENHLRATELSLTVWVTLAWRCNNIILKKLIEIDHNQIIIFPCMIIITTKIIITIKTNWKSSLLSWFPTSIRQWEVSPAPVGKKILLRIRESWILRSRSHHHENIDKNNIIIRKKYDNQHWQYHDDDQLFIMKRMIKPPISPPFSVNPVRLLLIASPDRFELITPCLWLDFIWLTPCLWWSQIN